MLNCNSIRLAMGSLHFNPVAALASAFLRAFAFIKSLFCGNPIPLSGRVVVTLPPKVYPGAIQRTQLVANQKKIIPEEDEGYATESDAFLTPRSRLSSASSEFHTPKSHLSRASSSSCLLQFPPKESASTDDQPEESTSGDEHYLRKFSEENLNQLFVEAQISTTDLIDSNLLEKWFLTNTNLFIDEIEKILLSINNLSVTSPMDSYQKIKNMDITMPECIAGSNINSNKFYLLMVMLSSVKARNSLRKFLNSYLFSAIKKISLVTKPANDAFKTDYHHSADMAKENFLLGLDAIVKRVNGSDPNELFSQKLKTLMANEKGDLETFLQELLDYTREGDGSDIVLTPKPWNFPFFR